MDSLPPALALLPSVRRPAPSSTQGSALVIVLAFIVLMTGITFAIFTRAMSERKISNSSGNQTKVSMLADGAITATIADLNAEIIGNSQPPVTYKTIDPETGKEKEISYYFPRLNSPMDMVPERVGTSDLLPNLVKRSASGAKFFAGSTASRASGESTITPSQNGRYVSPARWNSHYLLPKATASSDTDATPLADFTAPDWILVDKKGGNPTTGSTDVVGRYAYAIYDEGGLLDLNAAGYPQKLADDKKVSQRGSLAFADLTQLTEKSDGTGAPVITQDQIDAIVGRRNFVSASLDNSTSPPTPSALVGNFPTFTFSTQNAENYRRFALFNDANFLTTPRRNSLSGNQYASDRMFFTRQEMIAFLLSGVAANPAERASLQTALQYLTNFTRDLNQPSIMPPTDGSYPRVKAGNGSNASTYDIADPIKGINPNFLLVRRQADMTSETSVDGTISKTGDPVVSKKFPLNRIAWLTFKGPIADDSGNLNFGDADIKLLITQYKKEGITEDFLSKGGPRNIKNAFGLEWGADPTNAAQNVWVYRKNESTLPKTRLLSEVAATNREPDFFELLRAAVAAGAITRSAYDPDRVPQSVDGSGNYVNDADVSNPLQTQAVRDTSSVLATIQLGANIIDQFDPDTYPIQISIDDGTGSKTVAGVENLPYIYRVRAGCVMVAVADPELPAANMFTYSNSANAREQVVGGTQQNDLSITDAPAGGLKANGVAACLLMPDVWNVYTQEATIPTPGLAPTQFRVVVDSVAPDFIGGGGYIAFNMMAWKNGGQRWQDQATTGQAPGFIPSIGWGGRWLRKLQNNSILNFTIPADATGQAFFRDPTILFMANRPKGSNLGIDVSAMTSDASGAVLAPYLQSDSEGSGSGFINAGAVDTTMAPGLTSGKKIVGIPIGLVPLRWIGPRVSNTTRSVHAAMWAANDQASPTNPLNRMTQRPYATFRLQYLRPGASDTSTSNNDWLTYDTKFIDAKVSASAVPQGRQPWAPVSGTTNYNIFTDPRTAKFGPMFNVGFYPTTGGSGGAPAGTILTPMNNTNLEWLDPAEGTVASDLPSTTANTTTNTNPGMAVVTRNRFKGDYAGQFVGIETKDRFGGSYWQYRSGYFAQNLPTKGGTSVLGGINYYQDADGVVRPASGATATNLAGLPTAPVSDQTKSPLKAQKDSRPVMLNRPFRSVGELGYVFSGMPWKNIDFFHPQSGYSSLLDVFCINETQDPTGLVAGKLNLNTRQVPVLKAVIAGAYKNAALLDPDPTDATLALSPTLAQNVAQALVNRTIAKPLQNLSELVGKWVSGTGATAVYDGFSKDLFGDIVAGTSPTVTGWSPSDTAISGFGESAIRSLAGVGTTRVWNLMIDLIAQSGKYPAGGSKFVVEGEQHYWVHVAIDRFTGKVIDLNTEVVKE